MIRHSANFQKKDGGNKEKGKSRYDNTAKLFFIFSKKKIKIVLFILWSHLHKLRELLYFHGAFRRIF